MSFAKQVGRPDENPARKISIAAKAPAAPSKANGTATKSPLLKRVSSGQNVSESATGNSPPPPAAAAFEYPLVIPVPQSMSDSGSEQQSQSSNSCNTKTDAKRCSTSLSGIAVDLDIAVAEAAFLKKHPVMASEKQRAIDAMRKPGGEFERFDATGQIYLDYTGGGQYGRSQLEQHMKQLAGAVYGNPHSVNPTSQLSTDLVAETRAAVLKQFNASPDEYICIFTMNASGALRIVGESYPFDKSSHFAILADNHNSVNGIREFAKAKGARVTYTPVLPEVLRMDVDTTSSILERLNDGDDTVSGSPRAASPTGSAPVNKLFAYPAQSNFSGVKHPLDVVAVAQSHGWDVLLDAAAFAPTSVLDLSVVKPEFVSTSFYKMFGYPTGVGALLARKSVLSKLHRPWFAGGTIEVVTVKTSKFWPAKEHENFEDGTVSYMTIPAVKIGLDFMNRTLGGMAVIQQRVMAFTCFTIEQLLHLKHPSSGHHVVRVFGPRNTYNRGGTVTFDVYDVDNVFVSDLIVEKLAMEQNISIRAGCFCNPGASEATFDYVKIVEESELAAEHHEVTKAMIRRMSSEIGAVRCSIGYATNFADVFTFVKFIRETFADARVEDLQARAGIGGCGCRRKPAGH